MSMKFKKPVQSVLVTVLNQSMDADKLPYFDPTRMLIVDPMHNLFLGSAKHIYIYLIMDDWTPTSFKFYIEIYSRSY